MDANDLVEIQNDPTTTEREQEIIVELFKCRELLSKERDECRGLVDKLGRIRQFIANECR